MASGTGPGCLERDERIHALEQRVGDLEARLRSQTSKRSKAACSHHTPQAAPAAAPNCKPLLAGDQVRTAMAWSVPSSQTALAANSANR